MPRRVPAPNPQYLEFLKAYSPEVQGLALALRKVVLQEAAGAVELIYDAYNAVATGYTFTGRPSDACIHIAVYARWVNLGFNYGAQLPDPKKRLKGSGSRVRHIRIARESDLSDPDIVSFIRAAVAQAIYPTSVKAAPEAGSVVRAVYARRRRPTKST